MNIMQKTLVVCACAAVSFGLFGCSPLGGSFDIWIINTSGSMMVTNVKVTNSGNSQVAKEFPEDQAIATARMIADIPARDFAGNTAIVDITGNNGGSILANVSATVNIPTVIEDGTAIVVVVSGGSLNYKAEYVPVVKSSKALQLLRDKALALTSRWFR
jgi:hypothetical protein